MILTPNSGRCSAVSLASENNPYPELLRTSGTAHGMLARLARQTQLCTAMRTGAVALGRQILCADGELFAKGGDVFEDRRFGALLRQLRLEIPPCHVLPSACFQIARETAEQHPDHKKRAESRQDRAPCKQIDDPKCKIGVKQRMIERIHAASAVHEAHDLFCEFHKIG